MIGVRKLAQPAGFLAIFVIVAMLAGTATTAPVATAPAAAQVDKPPIYLTFDDGPAHDSGTKDVLQVLRDFDVTATFFMVGININRDPATARQAYADGHSIGGHGHRHQALNQMSNDVVLSEFTNTQKAFRDAGLPEPPCFRPPFGATNDNVRSIAASQGLTEVLWDVTTRDWERDPSEIRAQMDTAGPGDVILLHDGFVDGTVTANVVREWLADNHDKYRFLPIAACSTRGTPDPDPETPNPETPDPGGPDPTAPPPAGPQLKPTCHDGPTGSMVDRDNSRHGSVYRLYCAVFGRHPDADGFEYWTTSGVTAQETARWFINSPEYRATYEPAGGLSDKQFLTLVYSNVLQRDPEASGMEYFLDVLDANSRSRAWVVRFFSESPEFKARTHTS